MNLVFRMTFHGPFRVATGRAADGVNNVVDRDVLLPASSLKGVMRSAARDLLALPKALTEPVFGSSCKASPWSWSDAAQFTVPADGAGDGCAPPQVRSRTRIQIDAETNTVVQSALAFSEEVLAHSAQFAVRRSGYISPDDLPWQRAVLVVAARAVIAVGGDRRRGLGWVSVTPVDPPWTDRSADELIDLLAAKEPA